MKISVLTATYNRGELLDKLYNSLVQNAKDGIDIEWLVMDDGSTDNTKQIIEDFIGEGKIEIKYDTQENQGKMVAINNLVQQAIGDLIVECDSDDYFTPNAFEVIQKAWEDNQEVQDCYAMCFLKYNQY